MNHLEGLNPKQKEAARHQSGPLLIIAGAGAGKTKTIIARIANLIGSDVLPQQILAVTFTNKAAGEMRERLKKLLAETAGPVLQPEETLGPMVSTFHSLGVYILRHQAQKIGLNRNFTILDRNDSMAKIKEAMKQVNIDSKQFEPRKILGAISRAKGQGVTSRDYTETVGLEYFPKIVSLIWEQYENILSKEKSLDFDDLLLKTVWLFKHEPEILKFYQERWCYIHIDEYQDTNSIQYELAKLLAQTHKNICVVGDIDQSIYSWRGADFTNILNFENDYPEAKTIILEENYRSTKTILQAADDIIKKNKNRKDKNLFTNNSVGEPIRLYAATDEADEARYVAGRAGELIETGQPAEAIAVLYRANFQSRILEEAFLQLGIPYQVLGVRFFERKEIKDVLAYLKVALNPDDFDSLKRIINVPKRGLGKVTLAKMAAGEEDSLPDKAQEKIGVLRGLLNDLKEKIIGNQEKVSMIIKRVVERSGLDKELRQGGEDDMERLENIKELVTLATKYDSFPTEEGVMRLLTEAVLVADQDTLKEEHQAVRLMTVHTAKGLEFDTVFVVGLEAGLFPHQGSFSADENRDDEEERRLFYVALTRARHQLFLTYASVRTIYGSRQINLPSEFLTDLDDSYLQADNGYNSDEKIISY